MPGQRHDIMGMKELICDVRFGALLADKAFDANWLVEDLNIDPTEETVLNCTTTGMTVVFTSEITKYSEAMNPTSR